MKVSKLITTGGLIGTLFLTGVFTASAFEGKPQIKENLKKPGREVIQQIKEAVKNNDYDAWVNIHEEHNLNGPFAKNITKDNFHLLSNLHQARINGDKEKGKEILKELGLKKRHKKMKGMRKAKEAVKNVDFEAFKEIVTVNSKRDAKILEFVDEENFHLLSELHEAKINKDFDRMEEIRKELGLPLPDKK
jgi:hypothetical protein